MTTAELAAAAKAYAETTPWATSRFELSLVATAWLAGFRAATDEAIKIFEKAREPCTKS